MLLLTVLATVLVSTLAKNIVEDCGGDDAYIKFHYVDVSPYPFNILGTVKIKADVETKTQIGNSVSLSVNIRKSNLNGGFTWEVPCENIGAIADTGFTGYFGTCEYRGSCDFPLIKTWTTQGCPDFFKTYNVPCQCPFPPQRFTTEEFDFDLSKLEEKLPSWLIEGGYIAEVRLKDTTDGDKLVGCVKLNVDISARKPCPAILKKYNACGDNQS